MEEKKVVTIISITSDIGKALAERYLKRGDIVIGTYRSLKGLNELKKIKNCYLFPCDISKKVSIETFSNKFKKLGLEWDTFISCPCNPLPLKSFFESNFEEWNNSIHINSIEQLRVLYELYPVRNKKDISNVVYFAGGEINKPGINFSAYSASKIFLIKMCEVLNAENKDINAFIVGPGWVKTKVHKQILENTNPSDERHIKTTEFLKNRKGTEMDDIFNCIDWLCKQGKEISGGRNFSVVYDDWGKEGFSNRLKSNLNLYRLRRNEKDDI